MLVTTYIGILLKLLQAKDFLKTKYGFEGKRGHLMLAEF